jgi:DNA-binding transcriptional ArsR family regulator
MPTFEFVKHSSTVPPASAKPRALVRSPAALKALASPLRQEIVDIIDGTGPITIAEIAHHLGRAPDSLYFHLRVLLKTGLVVEAERRMVGKSLTAVYDVPQRPMRIDREAASPKAMDAVVKSILRLAARDYRRASMASDVTFAGKGRNHWAARQRAWLTPELLAEFNQRLDAMLDVLKRGRPVPGARPIAFSFVLTPVAPSGRAGKPHTSTPAISSQKGPSR